MNKNIYEEAIQKNTVAFAYHEGVFDDRGKMTDYIFIDMNPVFERYTGLKKEDIIGKKFTEEIALDKEHAAEWVQRYAKVIAEQKEDRFEEYSKEYRRNFDIIAYPTDEKHFVTLFVNRTFEKKVQEIARFFIDNMGAYIDYERLTEFAYEVSGAEYVAFNLFDKNGKDFETVSIYGETEIFNKNLELIKNYFLKREWPNDPVKEQKTGGRDITVFETLHDLTGEVVPKKTVMQIERDYDIGHVAVAKITKERKVLGDFTLFFKKGNSLINQDLFKLFLLQTGLFIEKTRLEKSLFRSQKRFFTLAEYAPVGFMACDRKGNITYANKKLLEIMDSPSYEATKSINLIEFAPLKKGGFSDKLTECMEKDREITYEMGYKSLWGKKTWLRVYYNPFKAEGEVSGAHMVIDDITEKKKEEDILKNLAERDALTKAFNRHALETVLIDRLNEAEDKNLVSCISIVDIDGFKMINDTCGHEVGDSVLKYLATRVKKELRENDLLIRTGGDEFLIYFHDIKSQENAEYFIKRIFGKISTHYRLGDEQEGKCFALEVGCSMGTSLYPRHGRTVKELMAKADTALYKVKNSGKSNYHILD